MSDSQEIKMYDQAPLWKAEPMHNWAAEQRGKQNMAIVDKRGYYKPLY